MSPVAVSPSVFNNFARPKSVTHTVSPSRMRFAGAEHRHDVRVVELRGGLRFAHEPLAAGAVELRMPCENLQRDWATERFLHRLEHDAHSTATEFAHDAEVSESIRQRRRRDRM